MSRKAAEDQVQLLERYIFGEIMSEDLDPVIKEMSQKDFSLDPTLDKAARTRAAIVWTLKQTRGGGTDMPPEKNAAAPGQPNPALAAPQSSNQPKKNAKKKVASE